MTPDVSQGTRTPHDFDQKSARPKAVNEIGNGWSGSSILLFLFGVILTFIGLYFVLLRPPLLPEDLRYLGASQAQLLIAAPHLTAWLTHVFLVLGGYVWAAGILTIALAATTYRAHQPGGGVVAAIAGVASIGLMTAVNFSIQSDFKWLLLGVAALWASSLALFWIEVARASNTGSLRHAPSLSTQSGHDTLPAASRDYDRHYANAVTVDAAAEDVFLFADDFSHLSSHMGEPSGMMVGGRMELSLDEGRGQIVGSHVRMSGRMIGIELLLEEVITERVPPRHKTWQTVGDPRLLVIGHYRLGFDIVSNGVSSDFRVFIDYDLPSSASQRWLGVLFGPIYAKWCVQQMVGSVRNRFIKPSPAR